MQDAGKLNDDAAHRLVPEMASFRLLVLAFVRQYITAHGASPSLGEIAAALRSNRKRALKAVKALAGQGLLLRVPGPRGLALPEEQDAAAALLRNLGWRLLPSGVTDPAGVTDRGLPPVPVLDYPGGHEQTGQSAQNFPSHQRQPGAAGDIDRLGAAAPGARRRRARAARGSGADARAASADVRGNA